MRKTLLTLLMLLSSMAIWAYDFEVDGIYYDVISGTSNVKIVGNDGSLTGEVTVEETVVNSGVRYNVTEIGTGAFSNVPGLTKLVIKAEIESFEENYLQFQDEILEIVMCSLNPPAFADPYYGFYKGDWILKIYEEAYSNYEVNGWTREMKISYITSEDVGVSSTIEVEGIVYGIVNENELCVYSVSDANAIIGDYIIPTVVEYNGVDYDVVSVYNNAFKDCTELTKVTIPSSVTSIGASAFSGCTALAKIECQGETPATLNASAFDAYNAIVYVPEGSKEAYKSASGWSNFAYIYEPGEGVEATTEDGFAFITLSDSKVAIIANADAPYTGDIVIPEKITYNDVEYTVTEIQGSAFNGNTNITGIKLPESITKLANYQFSGCTSLKTIELPSSITEIGAGTFKDCTQLNEITIPSSVTSIGTSAFSGCTGLTQIVLPEALKSIGADAFAGTALTSIEIPGGVERIADGFFKDCTTLKTVVLKSGVKVIGHNAFSGCTSLESITIPESVTAIGGGVLNNCTALTSLTIPGSVKFLGVEFCEGCTSLVNLKVDDSQEVLKLGYIYNGNVLGQFSTGYQEEYVPDIDMTYVSRTTVISELYIGCPLETIYLGRNIYYDDNRASYASIFSSKETITSVVIGENVTIINDFTFGYCSNITSLSLGDNITSIGSYAFYGCTNLVDLTLGDKILSIGDWAFCQCSSLTSLSLPQGLETIGAEAFKSCIGVKKVVIPSSVRTIGVNAFIHCSGITDLTIENGVETIGGGAFYECNPEYVVIPSSVKGTLYYGTFTSGNCKRLVIEDSENPLELEDKAMQLSSESIEIYVGRNLTCASGHTYPFDDNMQYSLKSLIISDNVTEIGANVFNNCTELRGVLELSENITSIGEGAFSGTNYSLCRINAVNPPAATSGMFNADELVAIIVPAESQAAYKAAEGWKDYNILVEKEVEVTVSAPGELSKDVIKLRVTPKNVTKLIVHGEINSEDFSQMKTNFTACHSIDLSDADCPIIPESALQDKKVLTNIVLPENCIEIKDWAFTGCNSLKCELTLPSGLKTIGYSVFNGTNLSGELVLPAKLETIKSGAFHGNNNLEKIVAEEGSKLSELDYGTFSSCTGLTEVDLGAAPMTTLHQETFMDCYSLTKVVLPSKLENLGMSNEAAYGVFQNCTNLETIEFPESLKRIYEYAFYGCTKLDGLKFPDGLREVHYEAFNGCSSLSNLDMNNCTLISNIGSSAFANCTSLKNVDLTGCVALETIEGYAFKGCTSLITLNLPDGLSTIGEQAFGECKSLANMTVPALVPPTAADDAFYHVNNYTCIIVTPTDEDSWFEYLLATPWGSFMDLENRVGIDVTVENDVIEDEEGNKHHCGHIWFDRDWHKHNKHNGGISGRTLSSLKTTRELADEEVETPVTDTKEINGHISDGLSLYVQNEGMVSFLIEPEDGYVVSKVLYGDEDVTNQLVDGVFTTPAVSDYTSLKVTFGEDNPTVIEQVNSSSSNDVCVKGGNIVINGNLDNADVRIYTLDGALIYKGNDNVISLEGHGIYIVTVNGNAQKVVL